MRNLISIATLLLLSLNVYALEEITGKVTYLEPTYLPSTVAFSLDQGNTTCPAGKILLWSKTEVEANKAAYSTILTAMMAGKNIRYYFNEGDTNCMGVALHIIPN